MHKVAFVTLGCPKNQTDTENLVERLAERGFLPADSIESADACVVNTCCFIDDAKRESIEAILGCADAMRGKGQLIVWGCMGERYAEQLRREIPEIGALFGVNDFDRMVSFIEAELASRASAWCRGGEEAPSKRGSPGERIGGDLQCAVRGTPYAYVKIAEGCDRGCSFCVIPSIRGPFKSIGREKILDRVLSHLRAGAKEIILVAQDITSYGRDLDRAYTLSSLVREIASLDGDFWVRLLYLHPSGIDAELIEAVSREEKVCKYIDVPVQHSEDRVLRAMRRGHTRDFLARKLGEIRAGIPGVALRTTVMVGYPGETEDDFDRLLEFVELIRFDRLGVFKYSPQEGTGAWRRGPRVPDREKRKRFERLMAAQSAIALEKNVAEVGRIHRVIVDEVERGVGVGRLSTQAPEIDGAVVIPECPEERGGQFAEVEIIGAHDYDLSGRIVPFPSRVPARSAGVVRPVMAGKRRKGGRRG
ncbi:MAG: 30S ribosomal protein S12 methylthiotransferase RimO [Thermodesulfovibrionales bacterium]